MFFLQDIQDKQDGFFYPVYPKYPVKIGEFIGGELRVYNRIFCPDILFFLQDIQDIQDKQDGFFYPVYPKYPEYPVKIGEFIGGEFRVYNRTAIPAGR